MTHLPATGLNGGYYDVFQQQTVAVLRVLLVSGGAGRRRSNMPMINNADGFIQSEMTGVLALRYDWICADKVRVHLHWQLTRHPPPTGAIRWQRCQPFLQGMWASRLDLLGIPEPAEVLEEFQ